MKKCFFVVMLCLVLFTSCDLFKQFDDSDYQPLYGRLSIDFNAPQSKTVQPTSAMVTCAKYKISGKHTNGATFGPDTVTAKSYTKNNIAVGDWQITVDGYNSSGVKIATSTKNVTITENVKTDVSFDLAYLTEGTGNYEVKFSIPSSNATLAKIECTLKSKKDSSTTTTTLTEFATSGSKHIYTLSATNVNTGAYELKAIFKNADNDTITVFGPEIVQVYTDLTSTAEFFFDENLLHLERVITPVISPANGTYNNPITITITTATPDATIYYTTNGDIPTSKSNLYTGAFTLAENNTTVKAFAVKDHMEDSIAVSSSRFIFKVATPVLDPANGCSTPTSQKITITCDTVGATIRYTLDGSTPSKTNGIIYTEPFDLTSNTNAIKAVGYKDNMADSDICTSTAKYTIYVAKPVIGITDLSDGKKRVTVSCATAGASIQYKIDSGSWINYTTPLEFSAPCTLYVQVSKTDMETNTASQVISWAKGDGAFAISSVPNYENLSVVEPDSWTGQISNLSKATVKTKWNNAGTSSTSYTWYLDGDIVSGAVSDSINFEDVTLTDGSHVLMVHSVFEGRTYSASLPFFVKSTYEIGDIGPAGGWIFYDCDADNERGNADGLTSTVCGWKYLEAAPEDLPTMYVWGANGNLGTKTGIGEGKNNTRIIKSWGDFSDNAARVCDSYSVNGYDDWFLPSKDELYFMYQELYASGVGNFDGKYWSSSEYGDHYCEYAFCITFNSFGEIWSSGYRVDSSRNVRPCRAF